jgi:hypothetical protein
MQRVMEWKDVTLLGLSFDLSASCTGVTIVVLWISKRRLVSVMQHERMSFSKLERSLSQYKDHLELELV